MSLDVYVFRIYVIRCLFSGSMYLDVYVLKIYVDGCLCSQGLCSQDLLSWMSMLSGSMFPGSLPPSFSYFSWVHAVAVVGTWFLGPCSSCGWNMVPGSMQKLWFGT